MKRSITKYDLGDEPVVDSWPVISLALMRFVELSGIQVIIILTALLHEREVTVPTNVLGSIGDGSDWT